MLTFRCKNDGVTKLFPQMLFYVRKVDVGLIFVDGVYRDGSCQDHQKSPSEREKILSIIQRFHFKCIFFLSVAHAGNSHDITGG